MIIGHGIFVSTCWPVLLRLILDNAKQLAFNLTTTGSLSAVTWQIVDSIIRWRISILFGGVIMSATSFAQPTHAGNHGTKHIIINILIMSAGSWACRTLVSERRPQWNINRNVTNVMQRTKCNARDQIQCKGSIAMQSASCNAILQGERDKKAYQQMNAPATPQLNLRANKRCPHLTLKSNYKIKFPIHWA